MKLENVFIVFRKEFLDVLRDRRTLISMILLPLGLIPLMIGGLGNFAESQYRKMEELVSPILVIGSSRAPELLASVSESRNVQLITTIQDSTLAREMLEDRSVQAVLFIPDNFDARGQAGDSLTGERSVQIWFDKSRDKSSIVERTVRHALLDYRDDVVEETLRERDLPYTLVKPFGVESLNFASESQMAGAFLGMILPYMVILLTIAGITYPAIDMTAGEKERQTMETLLLSPATRLELVLGKFLTAFLVGMTSAVLAVISLAVTFNMFKLPSDGGPAELPFSFDPAVFGMVFLLLIPMAALFAAVIIAIAVNARSYKEAQSYVYPLMLLIIFPAMASLLPGTGDNVRAALIPVVNVSLGLRHAMMGTCDFNFIALTFLSSALYAAFAIFIAVRVFQKESVLLRI
jgi:sodium transport system permease protein